MPLHRTTHVLALSMLAVASQAGENVTFEKDVRPILKAHCFLCHGEEEELKGGLDLRLVKLMERGGESGTAIKPGESAASLIYKMVSEGEMPPKKDKLLSVEEIHVIRDWIDSGAKTIGSEPEKLPEPGEFFVSPGDRQHWSFQPIKRPAVPVAEGKHPIDAFLSRKLKEKGLTFSEEADKATLIRRASFDLLGLPPSPEEVRAFIDDSEPGAWERAVDRLLDSPHYGEHWSRHWLDVAGYADSEGYNDKDLIRPDAWRYRDYVVKAFNENKPWDQFIIEQMAGDELVGATHPNAQGLANKDPNACEKLTATGFLRLAPDGSGSSPDDPLHARNAVITETVKIVSSSLLGLTVGCAECHDHRFDPIPQEDFYRLRAVFSPVYDTADWRMPTARRMALISAEKQEKADALEAEAKKVGDAYIAEMMRVVGVIFERELAKIPEEEREFARTAYETPEKERTPEQVLFLTEKYPSVNVQRTVLHLFLAKYKDGDELKKKYEELNQQVQDIRGKKPQPDYVRVATEVPGQLSETRLFHRGDFNSPEGDPILPADISVIGSPTIPGENPDIPTSGRRLAYAKHLTSGKHPLVARVLVNRFWMHHFGQGLVSTPGEFGMRSPGPSHPELLDWLASEFVESGWDLKSFHRLVLTSHAWRQVSNRNTEGEAIDSGNTLVWRMPVSRLEAETVRDSILAVSGRLNRKVFGAPIPVTENEGGLFAVGGGKVSEDHNELRRSLYVQQRRTAPVAMLDVFDAPRMEPNCELRNSSTVAIQALELMNGSFAISESGAFAERVLKECGPEADEKSKARRAWEIAYGTLPSDQEATQLAGFLSQQKTVLPARGKTEEEKKQNLEQDALASLCQVLFKTNQFLYVD